MSSIKLFDIFAKCIDKYNVKHVASELELSPSTVQRWIQLKQVPQQYYLDVLKLTQDKVDISCMSSKQKDQFFTPLATARQVFAIFQNILCKNKEECDEYTFIEPSAGNGVFLKVIESKNKVIALDIEPRHDDVMQQDFLSWIPTDTSKKYICFGNPPFGLRGNLALRFINHAAKFSEYVCFILPQLFVSDGKGVPRKRVKGINLIHSEVIDNMFEDPDGKPTKVNVVFQVWSKQHSKQEFFLKEQKDTDVKMYSLSDGGTPSSTRNKKMINMCDVYIPSTCFGKNNMKCYTCFKDLPGERGYGLVFSAKKEEYIQKCMNMDWSEIAFLSTNSAYNLRMSSIQSALMD
jgi:hypothetical protein